MSVRRAGGRTVNIVAVLNGNLTCPACHRNGAWGLVSKPKTRRNSTINELQCAGCKERIAAKMPHANDAAGGSRRLIQREFQTLTLLQAVFVQNDQYRTIAPVGWFDGVMVTRWFAGADFRHYVRTLDTERAFDAYRCAGAWLRRLHDSSPDGYKFQAVDVTDKLETLADRYDRMLNGGRGIATAWNALKHHTDIVASHPVRTAWSHGDFKPDNMLCDGHRYVGLDIHLQFQAPIVFDIASFLDHASLDSQTFVSANPQHDFRRLEAAFLSGYGELGKPDMIALRWAELYFALSYLGRSWRCGPLRAWYANWRVGPLVRMLAERLDEPI
jgi:hypothetical protein